MLSRLVLRGNRPPAGGDQSQARARWEPEHDDAEINGSRLRDDLHRRRADRLRARPRLAALRKTGRPRLRHLRRRRAGSPAPAPTGGEVATPPSGGTVAIDVPAATGAVPGTRLAGPYVLTYDGITGGEPDWVDQAPGGSPPDRPRSRRRLRGRLLRRRRGGGGQTVAVQLEAPKRIIGARKVTVSGRVVPAAGRGRGRADPQRPRQQGLAAAHRRRRPLRGRRADPRSDRAARRRRRHRLADPDRGGALEGEDPGPRRCAPARFGSSGASRPALPGRLLLLGADEVEPDRDASGRQGGASPSASAPGKLGPGRYQVVYIPSKGAGGALDLQHGDVSDEAAGASAAGRLRRAGAGGPPARSRTAATPTTAR